MSRFRYLGEPPMAGVSEPGILKSVRVKKSDGTSEVHAAPNQTTGFVIGDDFGFDFPDDETFLRRKEADTRYERIS